jgi:hypothetical protein
MPKEMGKGKGKEETTLPPVSKEKQQAIRDKEAYVHEAKQRHMRDMMETSKKWLANNNIAANHVLHLLKQIEKHQLHPLLNFFEHEFHRVAGKSDNPTISSTVWWPYMKELIEGQKKINEVINHLRGMRMQFMTCGAFEVRSLETTPDKDKIDAMVEKTNEIVVASATDYLKMFPSKTTEQVVSSSSSSSSSSVSAPAPLVEPHEYLTTEDVDEMLRVETEAEVLPSSTDEVSDKPLVDVKDHE